MLCDTLTTRQSCPHVQHARHQRALTRHVEIPVLQRARSGARGPGQLRLLPRTILATLQGLKVRQRRVLRSRCPLKARWEGDARERAEVRMRGVGEDDAARDGRGPGGLLGEPALPERQVQRGQLSAAYLDVLDLHDRGSRAGATGVLKVGCQRVGLVARREVLACRGEHA